MLQQVWFNLRGGTDNIVWCLLKARGRRLIHQIVKMVLPWWGKPRRVIEKRGNADNYKFIVIPIMCEVFLLYSSVRQKSYHCSSDFSISIPWIHRNNQVTSLGYLGLYQKQTKKSGKKKKKRKRICFIECNYYNLRYFGGDVGDVGDVFFTGIPGKEYDKLKIIHKSIFMQTWILVPTSY